MPCAIKRSPLGTNLTKGVDTGVTDKQREPPKARMIEDRLQRGG